MNLAHSVSTGFKINPSVSVNGDVYIGDWGYTENTYTVHQFLCEFFGMDNIYEILFSHYLPLFP